MLPNSVDLDFGNQTPKLHMRTVHGYVRTLNGPPKELLGMVAVLENVTRLLELHSKLKLALENC